MYNTIHLLVNNNEDIAVIPSDQGLHVLSISRTDDNDGSIDVVSTVLNLEQLEELYRNLGNFIKLQNGVIPEEMFEQYGVSLPVKME